MLPGTAFHCAWVGVLRARTAQVYGTKITVTEKPWEARHSERETTQPRSALKTFECPCADMLSCTLPPALFLAGAAPLGLPGPSSTPLVRLSHMPCPPVPCVSIWEAFLERFFWFFFFFFWGGGRLQAGPREHTVELEMKKDESFQMSSGFAEFALLKTTQVRGLPHAAQRWGTTPCFASPCTSSHLPSDYPLLSLTRISQG